jgi:hypothetical protein
MRLDYARVVVLLSALALGAFAATEEWRYGGTNVIFQIIADGKGGCAVTRVIDISGTSLNGDVLWFDKKGQLLYQSGLSNIIAGGIAACTTENLVYCDMRATNVVIHVTADGTATVLPAMAGTLNRIPIFFYISDTRVSDKQGFFASESDTNANSVALVRYRHK